MPECIRMMDSNAHRKAIGEQIAYASHFLPLSRSLLRQYKLDLSIAQQHIHDDNIIPRA